ncbi:hypothetical protein MYSTI_00467 [Myxococcus stipitatus DSM 14675]|uniref:DUF11 domain-containing protein n=1 Tax=Myxococcus stipitatus (strain DSM 14675 / JCM 12634 / Mx s8) TaxID=1278073 RepID=L7U2J7_MYXSD|nr:hypothetical protein [Myxococcus stipitatus]AGC41817.1 hypothetical protein MYSTI_00467 [Myxococcus stipitatus DSM 14675]
MRREARLQVLGLLLSLALPTVAAGAALEPTTSPSDHYGESFTFIGDLEDGTFVLVQLSVTNIGPGTGTGICRATVLRPGQRPWTPQKKVGSKEWGYETATSTLRVGTCSARSAGGVTRVEAVLEGGRVELEYAAQVAPQSPEGSEVEVGTARYRHEVTLAFSPLKATVQPPKSASVAQAGGGYADHTRSTIAPAKLARRWVRFRALRGEDRLVLLAREGQDGEFGPVYSWAEGNTPHLMESFTLSRQGAKEKSAWTVDVFGGDGAKAMVLRSTSLLQRSAPVEGLGVLGGLVKPVVGSPVTYLHRAVLEREGKTPVAGLMEVTLEGEP